MRAAELSAEIAVARELDALAGALELERYIARIERGDEREIWADPLGRIAGRRELTADEREAKAKLAALEREEARRVHERRAEAQAVDELKGSEAQNRGGSGRHLAAELRRAQLRAWAERDELEQAEALERNRIARERRRGLARDARSALTHHRRDRAELRPPGECHWCDVLRARLGS